MSYVSPYARVAGEDQDEPEVDRVVRPKLSRRAAMMSRADEQVLRSLREALATENQASTELGDLAEQYDEELEAARAGRGVAGAAPRGRHEARAAMRARAQAAPRSAGVLLPGVYLGEDTGLVVDLATRMYGDTEDPDLPAIKRFADAALRNPSILQSPTLRTGVEQVSEAVKQAFDIVFTVVDAIATATERELAHSDAGLSALIEARSLLIGAEYTLTSLLAEHSPTERAEHERGEEGLDVFQTEEATRMRPLWRRRYGEPGQYLRNAAGTPTSDDEERVLAEAQAVADRNHKTASVGRLWLADGGYRWAIRFDEEPVTFDDGSRFEPVHAVLPRRGA